MRRKLTKEQVEQIRTSAEPYTVLALRYGVAASTAWSIKIGRTYKGTPRAKKTEVACWSCGKVSMRSRKPKPWQFPTCGKYPCTWFREKQLQAYGRRYVQLREVLGFTDANFHIFLNGAENRRKRAVEDYT